VLRASPSSLMVRNHCCGHFFHLPVHLIPPSFTGSPEALRSSLHANAKAVLYAISHFDPSEPTATKAAVTRTLRAIAVARVDIIGTMGSQGRFLAPCVRTQNLRSTISSR
jgi:hypothetical protein